MRRQAGALAMWGAVGLAGMLCVAGPARAEIRQQTLGGDIVFTSRPPQKPVPETETRADGSATRPATPSEMQGLVKEVSRRFDMDPGLIATVIGVESGFNRMAVSPKGARGLMQLMPDTARQYGVRDVHDPKANIEGGVAYLRDLARRYNGDMKLALAAYNAGPEAVERAAGVPNFPETREYLRRIESRYGQKLAFAAMKPDGPLSAGSGSIQAARDENGVLLVSNRRTTGVTVVPVAHRRKVRR
jgi:hypothetical protein